MGKGVEGERRGMDREVDGGREGEKGGEEEGREGEGIWLPNVESWIRQYACRPNGL